jgi:uncharacterized protein HemX
MVMNIKKWLDENVGDATQTLQVVKEISQCLAQIDTPKLRMVKSIIESASKMKGDPQEIEAFLEILKLVATIDMAKLVVVKDIIANLSTLPLKELAEGLSDLPLKEIVAEMRK